MQPFRQGGIYFDIEAKDNKKLEILINTGFLRALLRAWQHPKLPQNEAINIAEAPKNAASALPEASLGEDIPPLKGRISMMDRSLRNPIKCAVCTGICASSKGVGNTWQQVFCRCGMG